MNLIDRIKDRLDDQNYRLQTGDFEDCATALVGLAYPGLAPISGGTDHGLDALLVNPDGRVLGLMVTSSRSWDGARRSLRDSLKSARSHGRTLDQVMVANLAEVNQPRRLRLAAIAQEFDCELTQVFDRAWFSNEFLREPDWRLKILGIPGGFSSFSHTPRGARPDEAQLSTIGRAELLADAAASDRDLVLWGVPGAGKSHVAGQLPGALFLVEEALPGNLMDDLLSEHPDIVVVDDAGARSADVQRLWSARDAERLDFRIAVTCWPHEKDSLADLLPDAAVLEVDLMSRGELSSIMGERGITRPAVLAHILEQAQGRPAWALNLADLLVDKGDWESVWSGNAVRDEVMSFLRRSRATSEALQLLATVALVGLVDQNQMRKLGDLFALTPTQREDLIRSVAVAGLLDVRRNLNWGGLGRAAVGEDTYEVVPRIIAASLAAEVYFAGHAAPLTIHEVKGALPERTAQIVQTQIHSALLGAEEPHLPTASEFTTTLDNVTVAADREELLRTYALVGTPYARVVAEYLATKVRTAVNSGQRADALTHLTELAQRTAQVIRRDAKAPADQLFEAVAVVASQGWDCSGATDALVTGVRHSLLGEPPSPSNVEGLAVTLAGPRGRQLPRQNWLDLAAAVLTPTFDSNYQDPSAPDRWVLQSISWPGSVLERLFDTLREGLAERIAEADVPEMVGLVRLMEKFVKLAKGYQLPFGGTVSENLRTVAQEIAATMAADLGERIATPGLRAVFNRAVAGIRAPLHEPDLLFRVLAEERAFAENWREALARRDARLEAALADFAAEPPESLMAWIVDHEADLALLPDTSVTTWVLAHLGRGPNPEAWLRAALDHGLSRFAGPLVRRCVELGCLTDELARRMLTHVESRSALMTEVIAGSADPHIVKLVLDDLPGEDLTSTEWTLALHSASPSTRQLLFTHPDRAVRSGAAVGWAAGLQDDWAAAAHHPNWIEAMGDLQVRRNHRAQWSQEQALRILARLAPEAAMDLLVRNVQEEEDWQTFEEWQDVVEALSGEERRELWRRLKASQRAVGLFWVLAGEDMAWISEVVANPDFPYSIRELLGSIEFQFHRRLSLQALAVALRPLNWAPDDLLWTLDTGTGFGREHERIAEHLETCNHLASSPETDLAKLGKRGIEVYQPRLTKALAAARRADIRGELGP